MYSCLKKVASTILLVLVQLNWSNIKDTFHSTAASCYWPQDVGIYNAEPQSNKNNARKRSEVQLKKWLLREILNPRREVGMINKVLTINTHFPWHHLTQVIWFAFVDHDPSLFPRWIPTWNLKPMDPNLKCHLHRLYSTHWVSPAACLFCLNQAFFKKFVQSYVKP